MKTTTERREVRAVPTNIITGFLGVGKTSAILNMLKNKPQDERWAVLVNEFGEIGVDGSLLEGQYSEEKAVFISEVPGGCMCCAAGLPMQIALNQLLMRAKPDRLLIEPTGLGHPLEVLQVLSESHYQDALSRQKTLTLVDARKLSDTRYTDHETFNQQIAIGDVIVGNKLDLYQDQDKKALEGYVKQWGSPKAQVIFAENGVFSPEFLMGETEITAEDAHHHHHHGEAKPLASELPIPESGYLRADNKGEGFLSTGWRFSPDKVFNREKLQAFLTGIVAERMKAVFISNTGVFGYNMTSDVLSEFQLDDCAESRIEIIATEINTEWEKELMECLLA